MNQLSLAWDDDNAVTEPVANILRGNRLRDYQSRISGQAVSFLAAGKSPLLVMATGTGKTRTACDVVRRVPGRVLWVAHRIELVRQAVAALEETLHEPIGVEEPGRYSGTERVVVASKDTVRALPRLERINQLGDFQTILFDECHHSAAASYRTISARWPSALHLGLTATPGRLDKRPLGLYDCQTEPYGIVQAIDDGWLVPIHAQRIKVNSVDLSQVGTVAGDFNQHELDEVMRCEESIHGVAHAILSKVDVGPVLSFATSVSVAERQCEILNRYRPGIARFVSGATATHVRRQTFADFGRSYRILVNVGVATEGTDLPAAAVIAMCRPTKSQSLFQQMLGRGLRPLPGIDNAKTIEDRIHWIRRSSKPKCLVLDFVGATGCHSVKTAVDTILGEIGQNVVKRSVTERLATAKEEIDVLEALRAEATKEQSRIKARDERRARDRARRMALRGTSERTVTDAQLIGLGGVYGSADSLLHGLDAAPTPGQLHELARLGVSGEFATQRDARKALVAAREALNLATPKQIEILQRHCPEQVTPDLTKKKAGWLLGSLFKNWRRKRT